MNVYVVENYSYLTMAIARQLLITSLLCLVVVLSLTRLWRHRSPRLLYGIWALMGLPLLVPFYIVAPALRTLPLPGDWHRELGNHFWLPSHPCETPLYQRIGNVLLDNTPLLNDRSVLLALWVSVSLLLMARALLQRLRFRAVAQRAQPLDDADILRRVQVWRERYGITRRIRVLSSDECHYAFTLGTLRPRVFLPRSLLRRLHRDDLDAVLGHELAHIRRYDDFWLMAIRAIHCLFFFVPITWVANRALMRLREQCCDAMTIRAGRMAPQKYLASLLRVLDLQAGSPPGTTLAFVGSSPLRERARRLMSRPSQHGGWYWVLALLLVTATIALTLPRYDAHLMPEITARQLFSNIRMLPPIEGARVSRGFSATNPNIACRLPNLYTRHPAWDVVSGSSSVVRAALAGEVIAIADSGSPLIHKVVHIKHASGLVATYAHVQETRVKQGDQIEAGQAIAQVATTGNAYLHFELHYHNQIVNPDFLL